MSSRSVKKILKQRENLSILPQESDEDEDLIIEENSNSKLNIFDLLNTNDNEDEDENENEEEEQINENEDKEIEKKEVKSEASSMKSNKSKSKKKKGKKNKSGNKKGKSASSSSIEDEFIDIDKTIQEVNEKFGELMPKVEKKKNKVNDNEVKLFSCQYKMFDSEYETRRMFGTRITNEERKKNRRITKRNGLVTPKDTWPMYEKIGLDMELLETNSDGTLVFKFVHSNKYQEIQKMFIDCVASYNPNNIANLLRRYPYHIDSLLQLSEVFKHSGDIAMAASFVERVLYSFDKSIHPRFNLTSGLCRLSYKYIENRSFFIGLFRHIQFLGRRGCWRTAFEFAKLLLGLDHNEDALSSLLLIDYYALMSKEYKWLSDYYNQFNEKKGLFLLPNYAYSISLATWHLENESEEKDHENSTNMLIQAIIFFPYVIPALYSKCGINDNSVKRHSYFRMDKENADSENNTGLKLLIDLYVERCWSAWKEDDILEWLKNSVKEAFILIKDKDPIIEQAENIRKTKYVRTPKNIYRHILLSDFKEVTASIPPEYTPNGGINMYDPIPPDDGISIYEDQNSEYRRANILEAFIQSLFPSSSPESATQRRNRRAQEENNSQNVEAAANGILATPGLFPENLNIENLHPSQITQTVLNLIANYGTNRNENQNENENIPNLLDNNTRNEDSNEDRNEDTNEENNNERNNNQ